VKWRHQRLSDRLPNLHERHDQPVSLVGWSFGGLRSTWRTANMAAGRDRH
jgi:hypothetical protein